MVFLLDWLCQLCKLQYNENQLDERNQTPKSRTDQLLDIPEVLNLPDPYAIVLSVQSQDYINQVGLVLNSSHTKGKKKPTLIARLKKKTRMS
jgi:hypothetical protein